jgi:phospholipid/cholesterol/gamma-HCH transport system substrate-binding protein
MNSSNKRAVIVGLFVFFAIAIVIAAVLTLGGQKKSFVKAVRISAVFKDVNGLAQGNNVWFSGVKIGTIRHISFDNNANVVVQMNIEEKVRKYIRQDAKAKISSDGLIGNKIVVIYGGTPGAPVVADNFTLTVENAPSSDEMLATLQSNNQNLLAITGNIKTISDRLAAGEGSIGKLLTNETIYNDLQSTVSGLKQTVNHAKNVSDDLSDYTAKLKQKGTLADDLVSDTVIFSRLRATAAQINEVAQKSNGIMNQLAQATSQVNNPATPVGTLLNDRNFATDLKGTLQNLESASQKLDENMEALQHNFLFRGYFRRKAKQEKNNTQANR